MGTLRAKARQRLWIAVAVSGTLTIGLSILWAGRKIEARREYAAYLEQGMASLKSGDDAEAVRQLGKYIRRNDDDVEALVAYAGARERVDAPRGANLRETIQVLKRILTLDPSREPESRKLLELYAKTGFSTEAIDSADAILAKMPDDLLALRSKTQSLIRLRRYPEALKVAIAWADVEPQSLEAQGATLWLMNEVERGPTGVLKRAEALATDQPNNVRFKVVRGMALLIANRPDDAKSVFRALAEEPTSDAEVANLVVESLDGLGLISESLDYLRLTTDTADDERVRQKLIRRLWQSGRHDEVIANIEQHPANQRSFRMEQQAIYAISLRRLGREADAAKAVMKLKSTGSGVLSDAWALIPDFMGGATFDDAGSRAVRDAVLRALAASPDSPYLRQCLAEAYVRLGEPELAVSIYREIVRSNPAWLTPLARLADLLLSRGRTSEAMEVATVGLVRSPSNVILAGALVRVWDTAIERRIRKDDADLFELALQVQKAQPGEPQSLPVYVRALVAKGDTAGAKATLAVALEGQARPDEGDLLRWAELSRAKGLGLEQRCLDLHAQLYGKTPAAAFANAYGLFTAGDPARGRQSLADARAQVKTDPAQETAWRLADARFLDLIQSPEALPTWKKLADELPDELIVQQAAISTPSTSTDRELQSRVIDRLQKLTGEGGQLWRLARARWLMTGNFAPTDSDQALTLLSEVLRLSPDSVEARFLLAQCLDRTGNTPKAIEHLSTAARLDPDSRPVALYFAQLLQKSGDFVRAREQLDRLTRNGMDDPEQGRRAAILLAQQGDTRRAVNILEDARSQSRQAEILLATLYYSLNQFDEAQRLSSKLLENPDVAAVKLAADLYASMGRLDDAARVLEQLDTIQADAGVRELLRADLQARYGDPIQALKLYKAATVAAPKNPGVWRALAVAQLQQSTQIDAIKTLADGLANNPDSKELRAIDANKDLIISALNYGLVPLAIGLVQTGGDKALVDTVTALCASDADQVSRALVYLDQLAGRYPNSLPVQLVVAERYLQFNQVDKAASIAGRATQAFPQSPEPPRLASLALARQGDWQQALGLAKIWRQRTSGDPLAADLSIAECLEKTGQIDLVAKQLEPYLTVVTGRPGRVSPAVVRWALAMHRTGRATEATDRLMPMLKPGSPLFEAWASAAVTELPSEQAGDWIKRLSDLGASSEDGAPVLAWAWETFGNRFDDGNFRQKGAAAFTDIESRPNLPVPLLLRLGSRQESRRDLTVAAALYQRAVDAGDPSGIALNNLASVLTQLGRPAEAIPLALKAVTAHPTQPEFLDTLAEAQTQAGQTEAALGTRRQTVRLAPGELRFRLALAEGLKSAGIVDEFKATVQDLNAILPPINARPDSLVKRLESLRS